MFSAFTVSLWDKNKTIVCFFKIFSKLCLSGCYSMCHGLPCSQHESEESVHFLSFRASRSFSSSFFFVVLCISYFSASLVFFSLSLCLVYALSCLCSFFASASQKRNVNTGAVAQLEPVHSRAIHKHIHAVTMIMQTEKSELKLHSNGGKHFHHICYVEADNVSKNSLVATEKFVERPSRGHLHDQHQVLGVAEAEHSDDEGVVQLVHDLRLPHHLLLHQLLIVTLQHFDGHVDLTPETNMWFVLRLLSFSSMQHPCTVHNNSPALTSRPWGLPSWHSRSSQSRAPPRPSAAGSSWC